MSIKIFKLVLNAVIIIILIASIYFNYSYFSENKKLKIDLDQLTVVHNNFISEHDQLQNNFNILTNKMRLIEESLKMVGVNCSGDNCSGYREGILSSIGIANREGRWLICYDSFEDTNPGDKSPECCKTINGTWWEGKCCASDRDNANWVGVTGQCSEKGTWMPKI